LCELTLSGQQVKAYDGSTAPGLEVTMKMPTHLVVDPSGNIILADYFTSCVRLLDPRLTFSRYLLTTADQGLRGPTCLWLSVDHGTLYVGQFDGKIHVFRLLKDLVVKLDLNHWD